MKWLSKINGFFTRNGVLMHRDAFVWVQNSFYNWALNKSEGLNILEFGSLDINGGVRGIFKEHTNTYIGVDIQDGPGVDIVADANNFKHDLAFDVVVCCEVFEHTPVWREIILNAHSHLKDGGIFIATMAGEGRYPHSAIDENPIREWEYYHNVGAWELNRYLSSLFSFHQLDTLGADLRCAAIK